MSHIRWVHQVDSQVSHRNEFKNVRPPNSFEKPVVLKVSAFGTSTIQLNTQPFDFYMNQYKEVFFYLIHHRYISESTIYHLTRTSDCSDDVTSFEEIMMQEINSLLGGDFFVKKDENLFINIHKNIVYDVELFKIVANKGRIDTDPEVAAKHLIQALELNHADYLIDISSYWTQKIRTRLHVERINLIYRLIGHLKQLEAYDLIEHYRNMVNQLQNDT